MNKKILGITVTILTLAMLTVPVLAGKGQNKMDFQLHLVGLATPPPGSVKTAGRNTIIRDLGFAMMGDMSWVQIGTETITAEWLDYEGSLKIQQHLDEEGVVKFAQVLVNEIIYIYDDPAQEEEDLRGTIVLKALGNNKAGNGGTFVGKGTGEFEGLVIQGVQNPLYTVANPDYDPITNPDVPEEFSVLDRIGTAMG